MQGGTTIIAGDIGGTHARFALAEIGPGSQPRLGEVHRYRVVDHDGLTSAFRAFRADADAELPKVAAFGVAAPLDGPLLTFPNSGWTIERATIAAELELQDLLLLNDFGAIAHAVAAVDADELLPLAGPDGPLPENGPVTVLGPGTGLGVAILLRQAGHFHVLETEGSHIGFAPIEAEEARVEAALRHWFGRCSVERVVSGPGLLNLYRALGGADFADEAALWTAAIDGSDSGARGALELFIKAFGSAAGDLALAHGSIALVVAGSLAERLEPWLRSPLFADRFIAKGRYRPRMEGIQVRRLALAEPGLLGAALAFVAR